MRCFSPVLNLVTRSVATEEVPKVRLVKAAMMINHYS
jgi:hypothetical protein